MVSIDVSDAEAVVEHHNPCRRDEVEVGAVEHHNRRVEVVEVVAEAVRNHRVEVVAEEVVRNHRAEVVEVAVDRNDDGVPIRDARDVLCQFRGSKYVCP